MYLGLDLETSRLKALLVDEQQRVVDSQTWPLGGSRPHPGWSEQQPGDWIAAAESALEALNERHPAELAAVRGVGLSVERIPRNDAAMRGISVVMGETGALQ